MRKSEKEKNLASVEGVLSELQQLQSSGNSVYPRGLFPSQRYHPFLPYQREDDNLFFTASAVHILQGQEDLFTEQERSLAKEISEAAMSSYRHFKNKDGLDTYNFWQTQPSRHFPNGLLMHRFKHFQIPDDVDDTALVLLTEGASKERVASLRDKLKRHANLSYGRAFNPLSKYHNLKCYSTFFGKKMYFEFDICVLSNLMRVILPHFKDELNEYDHGTLHFITEAILSNEHQLLPFYTAPNYPTTELILYHISRLIPQLPLEFRKKVEEKIKEDISSYLTKAVGMNKVLLENAAMKLQMHLSEKDVFTGVLNDRSFFFFHAGMITAFENPIAQKLASNPFFHLRYTSKALNGALLIENICLKRKLIP